ncbi:MAG: stress response translation initiation inhibitor YciH [Candidatus Lokiarchaeota archaeon]|nr:stress response translation initiation inhibitor YciH [Candidatus Lokiarchaeota archaeon]
MSSSKKSVCPVCSLPIELCVCKAVSQEESKIKVKTDKRKWGRLVTLLEFTGLANVNLNDVARKLKTKAACGGTIDGNTIELQGDHTFSVRGWLKEMGFEDSNIQVTRPVHTGSRR